MDNTAGGAGEPAIRGSSPGDADPVALPENAQVVELVAGNVVCEGADRGAGAARDAGAIEGLGGKVLEKSECALPNRVMLFEQTRDRSAVRARGSDVRVLLKAGQVGRVAAREAERPIGKDALIVDDVEQDFARRPLPCRVSMDQAVGGRSLECRLDAAGLIGKVLEHPAVIGKEVDVHGGV